MYFMTTCSGCEYSVIVQTMSGDEVSDMNNDDRQAEPSLTQMLQAMLANCEEARCWERVCHEQELAQCKEEQKVLLYLMEALMIGATQVSPCRQLPRKIVFIKLSEADDI